MDVNNVKSQMRKGMLEYCIMLLLHKEPAYASDIIQKLKEARLIGPPRKYYRLTAKGEAFLGELEVSWRELSDTVNHIANN